MTLAPGLAGTLRRHSARLTRHVRPAVAIDRRLIAHQFIRGAGIEIGALHNPLPVSRCARVRYVDRLPVEGLRQQYPELREKKLVPVDIVDDGERLTQVPDTSQAFVIANHFIEHCQNPIGAIGSMLRVLAPGGVLYLAVPDKRYTFDIDRPVTPIAHLLRDYEEGPAWSKRAHFEEWVRLVNKVEDEAAALRRLEHLIAIDYSIHFHVWTQAEILELFLTLSRKPGFRFEIELCAREGIEVVLILRKGG